LDIDHNSVRYERMTENDAEVKTPFQIRLDVHRDKKSILSEPLLWQVNASATQAMPGLSQAKIGDVIVASLWSQVAGNWTQVGKTVTRTLSEGAPFTFGRALGLGSEEREHGSQVQISGVAVFNRVLSVPEMAGLHFRDKK
jgi:hypothetical protein